MENLKTKEDIIEFAQKLNSTNLSPLRSGNVSVKATENNVDGFYITPSGRRYSSLKPNDIVFVSLKGIYDKKKGKPSSEWRFHQDIYINKKCIITFKKYYLITTSQITSEDKKLYRYLEILFFKSFILIKIFSGVAGASKTGFKV